jgi:O-antigen/teichoic acid export membrane protein
MTISGLYFWQTRSDINLLMVGILGGLTTMLSYIYQFQMACMNRDMKFKTEAVQNLIFSFTTMVTGVTLAYCGFGLYAVVLQPLSAQLLANIAIYPKRPLRMPRAYTRACIKKIFLYGGGVTIAGFLANMQTVVANSVIKWRWSEKELGLFGRSTNVRDMAGQNIASVLDRMLYPLMRADRDNQDRLRQLFLRGVSAVALLCTFGWAALTAISPEMIQVVMGPQWVGEGGVPSLLRALAPALFYLPLMVSSISVANALGNLNVWMWSSVMGLIGVTAGMIVGQFWGLQGAVIGMTVGQALWVVWCTHWALKVTKTRRRELGKQMIAIVFAGALSCAAMFAMRSVLSHWEWGRWEFDPSPAYVRSWKLLVEIAIVVTSGFGVYLGAIWLLARQSMREIISMIRLRRG